jgi:cysteine synthase
VAPGIGSDLAPRPEGRRKVASDVVGGENDVADPLAVGREACPDTDVASRHEALLATRAVVEQEGLFCGISSGAVVHVARRIGEKLEAADIVCLLPDGGWKYLSTQAWAPELERADKGVEETLWW